MFQSTSQNSQNNIDICSLVPLFVQHLMSDTAYMYQPFFPVQNPEAISAGQSRSRHDIDFIQITAGKWKRTVDPFAEVTPEAREKAQEEPRFGCRMVGGV